MPDGINNEQERGDYTPEQQLEMLGLDAGVQITDVLSQIALKAAQNEELDQFSPNQIAEKLAGGADTATNNLVNRLTTFIEDARETGQE